MPGDKAAVPSQHGGGLNDQEHPSELLSIEHLGQYAQHRTVAVIKDRLGDLTLQHEQLVTQRQDLGIAPIAARQQQTNTSQHQPHNERHRPEHGPRAYRRRAL
ncbi:MAG: hypothetical protein ACKVWR_20825 [Acidimicrobiales bacterium]